MTTDDRTTQPMLSGGPDREIEDLLPWYVAGTLDAADAAKVDAALAASPALRRSLAIAREELGETVHLNQSLGSPSQRSLDSLLAKVSAEPKRAVPLGTGILDLGARLAQWLQPKTLAWAGIAAAAIIAVQAVLLIDLGRDSDGQTYQTASQQGAGDLGSVLMVRFAPEATASSIEALLQSKRATIVGGPLPGGVFKIRIGAAGMSPAAIEQAAAGFRARADVVRFVALSQ